MKQPLSRVATDEQITGLTVTGQGQATSYALAEGHSLMVGSSARCGIRLHGDGVADIHCVIKQADGVVWVQDWFSSPGTLIDGRPISDETVLRADNEVHVGPFRIRIGKLPASPAAQAATQRTTRTASSAGAKSPSHECPPNTRGDMSAEDNSSTSRLDALSHVVSSAVDDQRHEDEWDMNASVEQFEPAMSSLGEVHDLDGETLDIYRDEIERLQSELAERDSRLAELTTQAGAALDDAHRDRLTAEESTALLERLEALLKELRFRDERVTALENLLRAADEANQALCEERRQIERWTGEIEQRIAQREADSQLEVEQLRQRIKSLQQQRAQLEAQQRQPSPETQGQPAAALERDQEQQRLLELRHQLDSLTGDRDELARQLAQTQQKLQAAAAEHEEASSVREERLQLAQERAELARHRAEFARQKAELEPQNAGSARGNDADTRVKALREHLREIHEHEKTLPQAAPSLAARLANIWRKLDG